MCTTEMLPCEDLEGNTELTQPRRRRYRERHKFTHLTLKNNSFAPFARALLIF